MISVLAPMDSISHSLTDPLPKWRLDSNSFRGVGRIIAHVQSTKPWLVVTRDTCHPLKVYYYQTQAYMMRLCAPIWQYQRRSSVFLQASRWLAMPWNLLYIWILSRLFLLLVYKCVWNIRQIFYFFCSMYSSGVLLGLTQRSSPQNPVRFDLLQYLNGQNCPIHCVKWEPLQALKVCSLSTYILIEVFGHYNHQEKQYQNIVILRAVPIPLYMPTADSARACKTCRSRF